MLGAFYALDQNGGITYIKFRENASYNDGISLGNYINTNIDHKITGNFSNYVLNNPLYMHEYGHTIDSRIFGLSYLLAIGIPSIYSANKANNDPTHSHRGFWTETRANRQAKKYFKKHGVSWSFPDYPLY